MRSTFVFFFVASALAASDTRAQEKKKPEPPPGWEVKAFSLENPSAGFKIALKGYIQADFSSYQDWTAEDADGNSSLTPDFEWQRARIGLEGEWRRLSFEVDVDPAFDKGDELKDAWIDLRLSKAIQLRGGNLKLPVSPEFLTSPAKTDFVERAAVVDSIGPNRDWGAIVHGEISRAVEYQAGVFEGDNRGSDGRAGTTAAARLVLKPTRWIDFGGSFSQGDVQADPVGPELDPEPKGLSGESVTGYLFFPSVYVNGRRLRWGVDARIQAGPFSLWGDFLETREQRKGQGPTLLDLPEIQGDGWSATATWLLTGEKKTRTIRPSRSLFGGPGAVEIAARYESLRFDDVDNEGFEAAGSRAANVRPAGYHAFTGGLSWWPSPFLRLVGDVVVESYTDALRAPTPGKKGNYVSLLGRVQVHLP
ncbi:MAG TPA: porin [Vicinamibacteria bacterium]|nr:porin [Vicinamibacteria bacterium]